MILNTLLVGLAIAAHDGPDPVLSYALHQDDVHGSVMRSVLGPDAKLGNTIEFVPAEQGGGAELAGDDLITIADDCATMRDVLPKREMTVSAWMSVTTPRRWGGVMSVIQDNGDAEKGWVLGYDTERFTFALASTGADDGDGRMTYLTGKRRYTEGKLHFVVATYDGTTMRLFVDGRLDAESTAQSGDILYPEHAPVVLGAYKDADEHYPHEGRLMDVRVYDLAAGPSWVRDQYEHHADRAALGVREAPVRAISEELGWQVAPILQYATGESVRVVFETTRPVTGRVDYGATEKFTQSVEITEPVMLGEVKLEGLEPGEPYFYKVTLSDDRGREMASDVLSFQTAAPRGVPVTFAIIGDTQDNPEVAGKLASYIWAQRPNFALHAGDLTGTGSRKGDWTEEFFPSMGPLMSRVTLYPVLGNHEEDARHYYKYFSLPEPEYYYSFNQGDIEFFMIDSNREVSPGSEQYVWLDQALGSSDATWKVAVHHHPPYSSDENDYGDTWKGRSVHGDLRMRSLSELYEKHGVDLVFNGHIHSYERTWPIVGGKAVSDGGVVYTITGGGGGGLEQAGPTRPAFSNTVYRGHHYCMARVNGPTLEFFAYDLENRLFDQMRIEKK